MWLEELLADPLQVTGRNQDYLDGHTEFANSLGMQSSEQVAYHFQLDMLSSVRHIDGPECVTLGFAHNIDSYCRYADPADLSGKRAVSSEAEVNPRDSFQQTVLELLWDLR